MGGGGDGVGIGVGGGIEGGGEASGVDEAGGAAAGAAGVGIRAGSKDTLELGERATEGEREENRDVDDAGEKKRRLGEAPDQL